MTHAKTCHMGGYRGPTKCCQGVCRHRINCNCPAGERIDRAYIEAQIRSLDAEREMWKERLRALPMVKYRGRRTQTYSVPLSPLFLQFRKIKKAVKDFSRPSKPPVIVADE